MVFLCDEGGIFDAPLDDVWRFLGSGEAHSSGHRHREVRRQVLSENSGTYSWVQDFGGQPARFTMRWTTFIPLGIAYEVLAGPFSGSQFFLYYTPRGSQTGVTVVGEFTSGTLPPEELEASVDRFFSDEFEQDRAALREWREDR